MVEESSWRMAAALLSLHSKLLSISLCSFSDIVTTEFWQCNSTSNSTPHSLTSFYCFYSYFRSRRRADIDHLTCICPISCNTSSSLSATQRVRWNANLVAHSHSLQIQQILTSSFFANIAETTEIFLRSYFCKEILFLFKRTFSSVVWSHL